MKAAYVGCLRRRNYPLCTPDLPGGIHSGMQENGAMSLLAESKLLAVQEIVNADLRLFENRHESSFRQFARMIGQGGVAVCFLVIPDLMTPCGLPIKSESEGPEPSRDVSIGDNRRNLRCSKARDHRSVLCAPR